MENQYQDWTSFKAWADYFQRPHAEFCPFWDQELTSETRFLYYEATSPLPAAAFAGLYSFCPSWRIVAAQIRHMILPDCFGIYLCRREWDKSGIPLSVEGVLHGAQAAEVQYCKSIPIMRQITSKVDEALCAVDEAAGWPLLEEACRIFREDWHTGSWIFGLRIFSSLGSLMRDFRSSDDPKDLIDDPDNPDDLGLLHLRCFEDPAANQKLREYFREYVAL